SGSNTLTGGITLGSAATIGIDAGSTLNVQTGTVSLGSNTLTVSDSGTATIASGTTGGGTLTKTGAGTLTLSGGAGNTFGGARQMVSVVGGVLSVDSAQELGNSANGLLLNAGTLQATATTSSARAVSLGAPGGTFDVTGSSTLTLTGQVSGTGNLTK